VTARTSCFCVALVVVAEVSNWWLINVDPSGPGVVGVGEGLSAGGDGKGDAAETGVLMTQAIPPLQKADHVTFNFFSAWAILQHLFKLELYRVIF
jgi:hypothetical protein